MPRRKKLKAGDDGACPQCRKLVPLVDNDRGDLVLRTHHVVAAYENQNGYDVKECGSSGYPPASPDEIAEGDNWQSGAPQRPGRATAIGSTTVRDVRTVDGDSVAEIIRNEATNPPPFRFTAVDQATEGISTLGEAVRGAAEAISRAAAARQDDFALSGEAAQRVMRLEPTSVEINGVDITDSVAGPIELTYDDTPIPFLREQPEPEPVLSVRDICQRIYQEIDPLLIRLTGQPQIIDVRAEPCNALSTARDPLLAPVRTVNLNVTARPCGLDATFNIVPSSMTSEATQRLVAQIADRAHDLLGVARPWSTDQAGLVALVLNAIRETYIDVTGAPPDDANVSVASDSPDLFMQDMQIMRLQLQPGGVELRIPIYGETLDVPGAAERLAREAAQTLRGLLLERMPAARRAERECRESAAMCICTREAGHDDAHRCMCSRSWPSATRGYEPGESACP